MLAPPLSVRGELERLGAAEARSHAGRWAARTHLLVLAAALLLAALTALGLGLPGLAALHGRLLPVLGLTAALALLGPLLRGLASPLLRPRPAALARRLDDAHGWKDAASTALGVERLAEPGTVGRALLGQATARLAALTAAPATAARGRPWGRRLLLALFALALLLPGVRGSAGEHGAGRGPDLGAGLREQGPAPDADRWLREHLRLLLAADLAAGDATRLAALARSDAPFPAACAGELALLWDDVERSALGGLAARAGERLAHEQPVDLRALPDLAAHLTPGRHRARLRFTPRGPLFTQAQESSEIVVEIPPPSQGSGAPPPTAPGPGEASPPPPAAPPEPATTPEAPPTPPPARREEAVTPLVNEGAAVSKQQALVAVRTPDGGVRPPPPVPLEDALRDVEHVLERAVGGERVPPAQRAYLGRYFRTLERLVGGTSR